MAPKKKQKQNKRKKKRTYNEIENLDDKDENKMIAKKTFKNQDGEMQLEANISNFEPDKYTYLENIFNFKIEYLDFKMNLPFNIDIPNEKILNNVHEMSKNNYFLYYYINSLSYSDVVLYFIYVTTFHLKARKTNCLNRLININLLIKI